MRKSRMSSKEFMGMHDLIWQDGPKIAYVLAPYEDCEPKTRIRVNRV